MRRNSIFIIFVMTVLVTACGSIKKDLGLARNSPDEFTVVKQAPLTIPPEYNLVPPTDKDKSVVAADGKSTTTEQARAAVLGSTASEVSEEKADSVFMDKLKVSEAKDNIRKLIEEDNGYIYIQNKSIVDKLLSDSENVSYENMETSTIDAAKESKRIKENLEANKPINEGEVPVIEKKTSTLDKIF